MIHSLWQGSKSRQKCFRAIVHDFVHDKNGCRARSNPGLWTIDFSLYNIHVPVHMV